MSVISRIRERLVRRFKDPEYRHSYVNGFLNTTIAAQIRSLRESRGWSQKELAEKIGTTQSGVSALENVNYSRWSIGTLRKLARAFDVALTVKFESFGEAIDGMARFSRETALIKPPFDQDPLISQQHRYLTATHGGSGITAATQRTTVQVVSLKRTLEPESLQTPTPQAGFLREESTSYVH